ncbi:hypothetical protein G3I62_27550 [Streptomyces sp. SID14446]|uniref:hypothetical protein n=1 Tax=Streptomyces sp. SID14446 TaxID=2706072 RepID=UPI0013B6E9BD|nr:hypothetical protein [Streptomyces sp. SID14446]NEB32802.1 hypothetical protein [Streptomyces sp. SID14446]
MSTVRTWRDLLNDVTQGDWPKYREALDAFREVPPVLVFAKLPDLGDQVVKDVTGLDKSPSVGTWSKLFSTALLTPPDWRYIELLVRIWANQHNQSVTQVLDEWAQAYRRCGGDPGPRFPPPAPPTDRLPAASPSRSKIAFSAVAVAVIATVSFIAWPSNDDHDAKNDPGATAGITAASKSGSSKGPLLLTKSWPTITSCDGATSVAMPAGGKPLASFLSNDQDFRIPVTASGGATWGAGHLYLTLSAKTGKTLIINDIRPSTRFPKKIDPPAWVAEVNGGCGDSYGRVFNFDLDKPLLADRGVVGQRASGDDEAPPNPLGPGFTVSAKDPAIVRVDTQACKGNYEWSLVISYSYDGHTYSKSVGPFRSMSVVDQRTVGYLPDPATGVLSKNSKPGPAPTRAVGCPAT